MQLKPAVKKQIAVIGSSNTDMIIKLERIPRPGETVLGGNLLTAPGGKGANQAVGAARAGGAVTFVARIGRDMFGDAAMRGLQRDGICVNYVVRDSGAPSGVALIFVAKNGENSIAVASGANECLSVRDLKAAKSAFKTAAVVLLQLETPIQTVQTAAVMAHTAGATVILNPAPARRLPDTLLKRVSIISPNETEAELLTGVKVNSKNAATKAARKLHARGIPTVILTLGAKGAFVSTAGEAELVRGFKVHAVDTTAAGDIFNGALAVSIAEGNPLREAVRFANAAAAISVTRMGAQPSAPTRKEIDAFLRTHR
jgi:ribokinase